jgi:hypothetical protein
MRSQIKAAWDWLPVIVRAIVLGWVHCLQSLQLRLCLRFCGTQSLAFLFIPNANEFIASGYDGMQLGVTSRYLPDNCVALTLTKRQFDWLRFPPVGLHEGGIFADKFALTIQQAGWDFEISS